MRKNSIISNYWDLINYNVHHIQHSELKASLILTAYGLVFGLAYDVSGNIPIPENYKYLLYVIITISIGCTLTSIFFAFKTYIPRINQKLKKSVFFFHDINFFYRDVEVYSKELISVMDNEKKLKELLAEQAFINGVIASDKYMNVTKAIKFMIYSFCSLILILIIKFILM